MVMAILISMESVSLVQEISNKTVNSLKGQVVFLEIEITNGELYAIRGDFDVLGANYIKLE